MSCISTYFKNTFRKRTISAIYTVNVSMCMLTPLANLEHWFFTGRFILSTVYVNDSDGVVYFAYAIWVVFLQ